LTAETNGRGGQGPPLRRWPEIDLEAIQRLPFRERDNKVSLDDFGQPLATTGNWHTWLDSLPRVLAADRLRLLVQRLTAVRAAGGTMIWMVGGHVIKTGLAPYLNDLIARGYITVLAMNGAAAIHDVEISLFGRTSEDVACNLEDGSFGMVEETGDFFASAYQGGVAVGCGLGEAVARQLDAVGAPHRQQSIVHEAWRHGVPCCVHVAIGCDILHQQPGANGAWIGELTLRDFRILAEQTRHLAPEGVVVNLGSAVIMPEVFLKAYTMARNLGCRPRRLTTANLDMIQHYRPHENILTRPTAWGGEALPLTGHHEIMIPLLHALLVAGPEEERKDK
jgi:hypothetical protein